MIEIVNAITSHIKNWVIDDQNISPDTLVKNWGFCELSVREYADVEGTVQGRQSRQPTVMTVNGTGDRDTVTLDDRYDFIEWVRIDRPTDTVYDESDDWGLRRGKRQLLHLRIVIAHKVTLGEDLIFNLVNELPENIVVPGFEFVFLDEFGSIDHDHETIYNTELGDTSYENHRFDWNLYVLNLTVQYIPCRDYSPPDFITDSLGNCLYS
jgi:hypothetical protein